MGKEVVKTKEEILAEYQKIQESYDKIIENKSVISDKLDDFVVGVPIGEGIYGDVSSLKGMDISLPSDTAEFTRVMGDIRQDIDHVDTLIKLNQELYDYLSNQSGLDSELSNVFSEVTALRGTLKTMKSDREEVYNDLDHTLSAVEKNPTNQKEQGSGSDGGGGGGFTPAADTRRNNYQPVLKFDGLFDKTSISNTSQNLASHEQAASQLLSQLVINGKPMGGSAYPVDGNVEVSDVGFNFATLQLALDFVDADITATSEYIDLLKQTIENNKTTIAQNRAKMQEYDEFPSYDNEGNLTGTYRVPKYDNAALQAEIDALTAENEAYEAEKTEYTQKLEDKKEVLDELFAYRNACNNAMDGMLDLFTAESLIGAAQDGMFEDLPSLLGVPVSFDAQSEMFQNLQLRLNDGRKDYSTYVKNNDSANFNARMSQYDSIVEACGTFASAMSLFASFNMNPNSGDLSSGATAGMTFDSPDACYDYYISICDKYDAQINNMEEKYHEERRKYDSAKEIYDRYTLGGNYAITDAEIKMTEDAWKTMQAFDQSQNDLMAAKAVLTQFKNYAFEKAFSMYLSSEDFEQNSSLPIDSVEWVIRPEIENDTTGTLGWSGTNIGNFVFKDANGNTIVPTEFQIAEYYKYAVATGKTDYIGFFSRTQQLSFKTSGWGRFKSDDEPPFDVSYNANAIRDFYDEFQYLNDDELKMFNYFQNTGRTDQLGRFMESRRAVSVQRHGYEEFLKVQGKMDSIYTQYEGSGDERVIGLMVKEGFGDGLNRFAEGIDNIFNADGELGFQEYKTMYLLQYLEEKYSDEKLMKVLSTGSYNLSSTIGNMAPSLLVGSLVNPLAGTVLMGASAGGNAREKGLQMGMSQFSAAMYGLLDGLSEAGLQYVLGGIDVLGKGVFSSSLQKLVRSKFLANMISEGFEESVQEILDPFFASLVTGGDIPFEVDWKQVGEAGIYGFLAAGLIGGGEFVFNNVKYSLKGDVDLSSIQTEGLTTQETLNQLCEKGILSKEEVFGSNQNGVDVSSLSEATQKCAELNQQFDAIRQAHKNGEITDAEFEAAKKEYRAAIKKIHPDLYSNTNKDSSSNTSTDTNVDTNTETNAPNVEKMKSDLSNLSETSEETDNISSLIEELSKDPESNQAALQHLQNKVNQMVEADAQAKAEAEANASNTDEDLGVAAAAETSVSGTDSVIELPAGNSTDTGAGTGNTNTQGTEAVIELPGGNSSTNASAPGSTALVPKPGTNSNAGSNVEAETDTGTGTPGNNANLQGSTSMIGTSEQSNTSPEANTNVPKPGRNSSDGNTVKAETDTGTGTPVNTNTYGPEVLKDSPSSDQTGLTPESNSGGEFILGPTDINTGESIVAAADTDVATTGNESLVPIDTNTSVTGNESLVIHPDTSSGESLVAAADTSITPANNALDVIKANTDVVPYDPSITDIGVNPDQSIVPHPDTDIGIVNPDANPNPDPNPDTDPNNPFTPHIPIVQYFDDPIMPTIPSIPSSPTIPVEDNVPHVPPVTPDPTPSTTPEFEPTFDPDPDKPQPTPIGPSIDPFIPTPDIPSDPYDPSLPPIPNTGIEGKKIPSEYWIAGIGSILGAALLHKNKKKDDDEDDDEEDETEILDEDEYIL